MTAVPVLVRHLVEDDIAQDAGIVHHDIDLAEGLDRFLHHRAGLDRIGHGAEIRHRLAARMLDLANDLARRRIVLLVLAGERHARIVDHHFRAVGGHEHGDFAADPATGPGHERHLVLQHLFHLTGSLDLSRKFSNLCSV